MIIVKGKYRGSDWMPKGKGTNKEKVIDDNFIMSPKDNE